MAETRARLKQLVSQKVRLAEQLWEEQYGPGTAEGRFPRYIYRVLCGQLFAATGNPAPCSQVLGIAVLGWMPSKQPWCAPAEATKISFLLHGSGCSPAIEVTTTAIRTAPTG